MAIERKILWFVLVILVFIVIIEAIYYFLTPQGIEKKTRAETATNITTTPKESKPPGFQATSQEALDYLKSFKRNTLTFSIVVNHYQGKMSEVNSDGGTKEDGVPYSIKLTIKDALGNPYSFFLSEKDLAVFQVIEADFKPISLEDLAVGDQVSIKENLDLLKNERYEFRIARY